MTLTIAGKFRQIADASVENRLGLGRTVRSPVELTTILRTPSMDPTEVEQVLANWIAQATSRPGQLSDDVDPAVWVSRRFLNWWRAKVEEDLSGAESAVEGVRQELIRLGGWKNKQLGEALHELTHASEALRGLRAALGLPENA